MIFCHLGSPGFIHPFVCLSIHLSIHLAVRPSIFYHHFFHTQGHGCDEAYWEDTYRQSSPSGRVFRLLEIVDVSAFRDPPTQNTHTHTKTKHTNFHHEKSMICVCYDFVTHSVKALAMMGRSAGFCGRDAINTDAQFQCRVELYWLPPARVLFDRLICPRI